MSQFASSFVFAFICFEKTLLHLMRQGVIVFS